MPLAALDSERRVPSPSDFLAVIASSAAATRERPKPRSGSGYDRGMEPVLERDLDTFRAALEARFGEDLIALIAFGSQVLGTARAESDLDLLVVIRGLPRRRLDRQGLLISFAHQVSDDFASRMSAIPLTPEEAVTTKPFYLGMLEGHRVLVDRDGFFARIMERLQRRLVELGSRRLTDELGNPYWDLKPDYVLGEDIVL
jgi:predicted nucleotidyltransferase